MSNRLGRGAYKNIRKDDQSAYEKYGFSSQEDMNFYQSMREKDRKEDNAWKVHTFGRSHQNNPFKSTKQWMYGPDGSFEFKGQDKLLNRESAEGLDALISHIDRFGSLGSAQLALGSQDYTWEERGKGTQTGHVDASQTNIYNDDTRAKVNEMMTNLSDLKRFREIVKGRYGGGQVDEHGHWDYGKASDTLEETEGQRLQRSALRKKLEKSAEGKFKPAGKKANIKKVNPNKMP